MAKRDIGGFAAFFAVILPDRTWHWGWELVRAQLGEATVKWLEHAASDASMADWMPWLWRAALVGLAAWLFWPHIKERVFGPRYMPLAEAAQRLYEKNTESGSANMARHFGKSEDDIIEWFVLEIKALKGVSFFGKRIGSREREEIPDDKMKFLYPRKRGAELAKALLAGPPEYTDPEIRCSHYRKYVMAPRPPSVFD
jgi:hypothetical protein